MAVQSNVVAVATTPARIDVAESDNAGGHSVLLWNDGPDTVYVGPATVTSSTGVPVPAASWSPGVELSRGEVLYGICATSKSASLRVLETGA